MSGATHLALLRGINVGRARRVAMADLKALVEGLGHTGVRTVLASGNVLFTASGRAGAERLAGAIEAAVASDLGVESRVTVLTAAELAEAVAGNPLAGVCTEPKRLQVAVLTGAAAPKAVAALLGDDWAPEALAARGRFAWLWCPDGVIASRVYKAVDRAAGDAATVRNLATLTRLHALAGGA